MEKMTSFNELPLSICEAEKSIIENYIRDHHTIFNIGTNIGEWTTLVLKKNPYANVHLFEFHAQRYDVLKNNFQHELLEKKVYINNLAISYSVEDKKLFYYYEKPDFVTFYRHFYLEKEYHFSQPEEAILATTTIDSYSHEKGIQLIDFLKIGATDNILAILNGAKETLTNNRINFIQFEHQSKIEESFSLIKNVFSYLKRFNYFFLKIDINHLVYIEDFSSILENQDSNFLAINNRLRSLILSQSPEMLPLSNLFSKYSIQPKGVIHIGAHEGQEMEKYLEMKLNQIVCIEANPRVFEKLQNNVKKYSHVKCICCAVSDREAIFDLHITSIDQSSSILPLKKTKEIYPQIQEVETIKVIAKTLDQILNENNIDPAAFNILNIDIQGAELLALQGAKNTLKFIEAINTEINYDELYENCALVDQVDNFLISYGFKRVETTTPYHPSWGDALYIKQNLITMSTLGKNGRFANQIFQYAFLKIYAQAHSLRVATPTWIGQYLFGHDDPPCQYVLPILQEKATSNLEEAIVPNSKFVFKNVDFWGYFQYHTEYYHPHKKYFRSLFIPIHDIKVKMDQAVDKLRALGKTIVGLHLRRGDYGYRHYFIAPTQWYLEWLNSIWLTLDDPVLFIASDEIDQVVHDFSQYNPITAQDICEELPNAPFYADFYLLSHCDVLAISNSSFSFTAAMLNEQASIFVRPHLPSRKLISFDPWNDIPVFSDAKVEDYIDPVFSMKTPVVLIIFNRPETTAQVFEVIRQVKPPKLLVIADGPRSDRPEEAIKCFEARAIIDTVNWDCEVFLNYSNVNLGCRQRIVTGLNWVFEQVEEAIILEDDCLPDPTFFRYCEELLEKYRHDTRVMMIAGNNFQFGHNKTEYSYYFSRYGHIWGWATWKRSWTLHDDTMSHWQELRDQGWLQQFLGDEKAADYWSRIFQSVFNGFNTWDFPLQLTLWSNYGLTILPNQNLVSNIGFGSGTHTTMVNSPLANMPIEPMSFPLKHPPYIIEHLQADSFTEETIFSGASRHNKKSRKTTFDLLNLIEKNDRVQILTEIDFSQQCASSFYIKAVAELKSGQETEAERSLEYLVTHVPSHRKGRELFNQRRLNTIDRLIMNQEIEAAFGLLNKIKAQKYPVFNVDFLRAQCFVSMDQPVSAIRSLQEELRYFPEHEEAQSLLDQLLQNHPEFINTKIEDPEFQALYDQIRPYTMLTELGLYNLFQAAKRICLENIPGNFVECGVAAGGTIALLAAIVKRYSQQPRRVYGLDSFEGMPTPTAFDSCYGIPADQTGWGTGTCAASEANVWQVCRELEVDSLVQLVKGYFQDSVPFMRDRVGMIALLHLDADWYESTKIVLEHFYDRLSNSAIVQLDDYSYWEGVQRAVHEFEADRGLKFELNQIDRFRVWFSCTDKYELNPVIDRQWIKGFKEDDPVRQGIQSQMSENERFQLYYALRHLLLPALPSSEKPLRFVEIGSFAGSSLFLNYKALSRFNCALEGWAIDPGLHPQLQKVLEQLPPSIQHLKMFSQEALSELQTHFESDGNFPSYIFVDGDHSYEGVKQDIFNYYPLLAPGGLMIFHDYLPPLDDRNREGILFHHGGKEPGIRQACQELMEETYHCEAIEVPLLYPTDPTQTQAHLPIIPGVFSTLRVYRKHTI